MAIQIRRVRRNDNSEADILEDGVHIGYIQVISTNPPLARIFGINPNGMRVIIGDVASVQEGKTLLTNHIGSIPPTNP